MIEIICAGYGGQGVLTAGMMLIHAAKAGGMNVCWYPSYGSEMRGGTANCSVKLSDEEIASPYCKNLDILFTMNEMSIDKFEKKIKPNGYLFVNTDLVDANKQYRKGITVVKVAADSLADKVGNTHGSNLVMIGALAKVTGIFDRQVCMDAICKYFVDKGKGKYNAKNVEAFEAGYSCLG